MKRFVSSVVCGGLLAAGLFVAPARAATGERVVITSKAPDAIEIVVSVFKPATASASSQVPMVLHSHGWGGSRSTTGFDAWLDAGYGVLSFDQRGFGESGGQANVEDPELEGKDIESVVDYIASLDWVAKQGTWSGGGADPWLFAIGGSYGGGYQTIGSLTEVRNYGSTRFDALAPEITWYDLPESLGPQGPVRSVWVTALYAVGAAALPTYVHQAQVEGIALGYLGDGSVPGTVNLRSEFLEHSPRAFSDAGVKLPIPVLIGQGITDNLFNLNQGIHNMQNITTPAGFAQSLFVGYNGGHVLPDVYPAGGNPPGGDPCSAPAGGFATLSRAFFGRVYAGQSTQSLLPAKYNLASSTGTACLSTNDVDSGLDVSVGTIASPTGLVGPLQQIAVAAGPVRVTGIPTLSGNLTSVGVEQRLFFGLSMGTSVADAALQGNNVMPLRQVLPVVGAPFSIELPGVGIDVPAGQTLYLTLAPTSVIFAGFGSRVPGAMLIENAQLHLPGAA